MKKQGEETASRAVEAKIGEGKGDNHESTWTRSDASSRCMWGKQSSLYRCRGVELRRAVHGFFAGLGANKRGRDVVEVIDPIPELFGVVRPDLRYVRIVKSAVQRSERQQTVVVQSDESSNWLWSPLTRNKQYWIFTATENTHSSVIHWFDNESCARKEENRMEARKPYIVFI